MTRSFAVSALLLLLAGPAWAQSAPGLDPALLPHDITIPSMLEQADWVVKTVMVILVLASVVTLSIWIFKVWEILSHRRSMASAIRLLAEAPSLGSVAELPDVTAKAMVQVALKETERYPATQRRPHAEAIKERVAALIQRVEAGQQRRLSRGASVLGSIGASAPFIGLFGTVWGIMNSFIGIAHSQTTNLAVVAPGIAEALLATAFGLVAAIPAVLIYNAVIRAIAGYRLRMNDAATQIMCLLSRDLELDGSGRKAGVVHGV